MRLVCVRSHRRGMQSQLRGSSFTLNSGPPLALSVPMSFHFSVCYMSSTYKYIRFLLCKILNRLCRFMQTNAWLNGAKSYILRTTCVLYRPVHAMRTPVRKTNSKKSHSPFVIILMCVQTM